MEKKRKGHVKFFTDYRGYGFIESEKEEYFVHVSAIHTSDARSLTPGDEVEFTPRDGKKGPMAVDVRILKEAETNLDDTSERWVFMKQNPFTPQDPVTAPEKFAGRKSDFFNAVDAIYNSKNVLISGARGIGKSSLAYQLCYLANGENALAERLGIDLGGETFDRMVGDYRCTPGNSLSDILTGLLATLQNSAGEKFNIRSREQNLGIDLKYFKVGGKELLEPVSTADLATMFAVDVMNVFSDAGTDKKGIVFLIDEIDVLLDDVDLAPLLKSIVEKLRMENHLSVSFILSGVTGTSTNLLIQHPSAGRLFENISVGAMTAPELTEIIDLTLEDTGVEITDYAKERIVALANNFPQPVHLIGYHAFRLDSDGFIDESDVEKAKNFIVTSIKHQEFKERFDSLIQGGVLEVTRLLAIGKYETVTLNYFNRLISKMGQRGILSALSELEDHGIVEEQSKEIWRFRDPLFKVYLRWTLGIDDIEAGKERGRQGHKSRNQKFGKRKNHSKRKRSANANENRQQNR